MTRLVLAIFGLICAALFIWGLLKESWLISIPSIIGYYVSLWYWKDKYYKLNEVRRRNDTR